MVFYKLACLANKCGENKIEVPLNVGDGTNEGDDNNVWDT